MTGPAVGAVVDLSEVTKVLREVEGRAQNLMPVFRGRIGPDVSAHMREQYESQGAHLGTRWPNLSPTTIKLRTRTVGGKNSRRSTSRRGRAKGGFARVMWDTGRSRASLVNLADPEGIREYGPTQMVWGSTLAYLAPHHAEGGFNTRLFGKGPLKRVPPRPVVPREWPAAIAATWGGWVSDYLGGR